MNLVRARSNEIMAAVTVILVLFAPFLQPVQVVGVSVLALALLLAVSPDRRRTGLLALLMGATAAALIVIVRVVSTGR